LHVPRKSTFAGPADAGTSAANTGRRNRNIPRNISANRSAENAVGTRCASTGIASNANGISARATVRVIRFHTTKAGGFVSTIQPQITSTARAGRNGADRYADLRQQMMELLSDEIAIPQTDLIDDWRRACFDAGIPASRIESASPAALLRELESSERAIRDMLVVDGQRVKSVHWAAAGYTSPTIERAKERRARTEREARTIRAENAGKRIGDPLESVREEVAELRARLEKLEARLSRK
jgi:hypothetical protein